MADEPIDDTPPGERPMEMDAEKIGNGLVNVVLGALILWVAQTTFHHSGELAAVDQKFDGVMVQTDNVRSRVDHVMDELNTRTQSRFTSEDGEKLASDVGDLASLVASLERRLVDRMTELHLKVIALETQSIDHHEIVQLRTDLERIQAGISAGFGARYVAGRRGVDGAAEFTR
ncbi:MAG: hypothetical protein AAFV43_07020 [Planctomycetota bacterium]